MDKSIFIRLRRGGLRLISLLMALLMLFSIALADEMPSPTRNPDANPYDSDHPELLDEDQLVAAAAILIEEHTGRVIFEKNPDAIMYPASTTKIVTVLLGIMMCEMDEVVTVSARAVNLPEDSSTMGLREGEQIIMRDLLYGTMLRSGNDGAIAIAEHVSGSVEAFVDLMNEFAVLNGCYNTHFVNPHGLHDDAHYSTARDLAMLTRVAMDNEVFRKIAGTTSYNLPRTNAQRSRTITTRHKIMRVPTEDNPNRHYYQHITGVKSGSHSRAAYCYVGSATKEGVDLISVVLYSNSSDMYGDTKKLMEYGFSQFISVTPVELYNMNPITLEASNFSLNDTMMGQVTLSCVPADEAASQVKITATKDEVEYMAGHLRDTVLIEYARDFSAPITAGEVLGTMTYVTQEGDLAVFNLTANRSVARRENIPKTLEEIVAETEADENPFPPFSLDLLLIFLSPLIAFVVILLIARRIYRRIHKRQERLPRNSRRYLK